MATREELTDTRNARFLRLLEPIYKDCERWAFSRTQNRTDAEDVLSQAVLTGLENFHQLKNEGAFKTWFFRIISNTHLQNLRRDVRRAEPVDPEVLSGLAGETEDQAEQEERARYIRSVLSQLSEEQRQSLVLFELFEFSIKQVAEIMGRKEGTVRVLLHRARERMAGLMKKQ